MSAARPNLRRPVRPAPLSRSAFSRVDPQVERGRPARAAISAGRQRRSGRSGAAAASRGFPAGPHPACRDGRAPWPSIGVRAEVSGRSNPAGANWPPEKAWRMPDSAQPSSSSEAATSRRGVTLGASGRGVSCSRRQAGGASLPSGHRSAGPRAATSRGGAGRAAPSRRGRRPRDGRRSRCSGGAEEIVGDGVGGTVRGGLHYVQQLDRGCDPGGGGQRLQPVSAISPAGSSAPPGRSQRRGHGFRAGRRR